MRGRKSEIADGMRIDWEVSVEMDDGVVLRCDVYRPIEDGRYPRSDHLRDLRKVAPLRGRLPRTVAPHGWSNTPTWPPAPPTNTRTGRSWTRRNGCRTATSACGWTPEAPVAHRDIWTPSRIVRPRIFTTASSGRACSPGATGRSASTAFRITPSTSGRSPA